MVNELCFHTYVNSVDSPTTLLCYKVLLYCPRFSAIILEGVSYSFMYLRFLFPPPRFRPEHTEVSNRVSANIAPHPKLISNLFFVDEIFPRLVCFQTFTLQSSTAFRSCGFDMPAIQVRKWSFFWDEKNTLTYRESKQDFCVIHPVA